MTLSRNFVLSFSRILLLRSARISRPRDAERSEHTEPKRFYFRSSMTTDTPYSRNFALVLIFYVHLNPPPSCDLNKLSRNGCRAGSRFEKKTLLPKRRGKKKSHTRRRTSRRGTIYIAIQMHAPHVLTYIA